jgi:hypothetical protein
VIGHRTTPKGSYTITEEYLKEIPIPAPRNKTAANAIIDLVKKLEDRDCALTDLEERLAFEKKLEAKVAEALAHT